MTKGAYMAGVPSEPQPDSTFRATGRDSPDLSPWTARRDVPDQVLASRPADGLITMVEAEIIPRLMLAHRGAPAGISPAPASPRDLGPATTETFARMVVTREPESLIAFVGSLLQGGVSLDIIYRDLLIPAARRLGEYWDEDSASFTDVTVGLGRLQQVVRALGWKAAGGQDSSRLLRSAFFAPGPGEQHIFGLFIVEDVFRRAGWRTWVETSPTQQELVETVQNHWFDLFGLSISCDTSTEVIGSAIRGIREASRNPNIFVMVGGRLFLEQPDLLSAIGADAMASTGGEALLVANHALLIADNEVSALTAGG